MWVWSIWETAAMNCNFNGFLISSFIYWNSFFWIYHSHFVFMAAHLQNFLYLFMSIAAKNMSISYIFIVQWFLNLLVGTRIKEVFKILFCPEQIKWDYCVDGLKWQFVSNKSCCFIRFIWQLSNCYIHTYWLNVEFEFF